MSTPEQAPSHVSGNFEPFDNNDKIIEDMGFAYYIYAPFDAEKDDIRTMTVGNGPIIILKSTGEIFSFSSSPRYMFGDEGGHGVNTATSLEEFNAALNKLRASGDPAANPIGKID